MELKYSHQFMRKEWGDPLSPEGSNHLKQLAPVAQNSPSMVSPCTVGTVGMQGIIEQLAV
jgi:hypothetical protein